MPELLLRPDLGKKAYRLRCRFRIGAFPSERTLEKAKYEAAGLFVRDMAKQGWQHVEKHGFRMSGPFAAVETISLPKRSQQERWHTPSRELLPAMLAGYRVPSPSSNGSYVKSVPPIAETDSWEFELAAVFVHETILTELPAPHEERN